MSDKTKASTETKAPAKAPVYSYDFTGDKRPDGQPHVHLSSVGIPPRLLTRDEYQALSREQKKAMKESGLYEPVTERAYKLREAKYANPETTPDSTKLTDPAFRESGTVNVTEPPNVSLDDGIDEPDGEIEDRD
jgi:hypothetical protein